LAASAFVRCCALVTGRRFSIWLLVVNFNFSFSIGLWLSADDFQIPQQRQALSLAVILTDSLLNTDNE